MMCILQTGCCLNYLNTSPPGCLSLSWTPSRSRQPTPTPGSPASGSSASPRPCVSPTTSGCGWTGLTLATCCPGWLISCCWLRMLVRRFIFSVMFPRVMGSVSEPGVENTQSNPVIIITTFLTTLDQDYNTVREHHCWPVSWSHSL